MVRKILSALAGAAVGIACTFFLLSPNAPAPLAQIFKPQKQVVGFLPFGLLSKADKDYSEYITTLAYFGLTIDQDGSILKMDNSQEEEPGWYTLASGKADQIFNNMTRKGVNLSLVVFSGDDNIIYPLISDPIPHARTLVSEVAPIMKKYSFKDLNLDIESPKEASSEARVKFTQFAREIKTGLAQNHLGTLTVDVSPTIFVKKYLIDPQSIGSIADYVLIMAYDYHYPGSYVSGPVAPLYGAGAVSEFDTNVPVQEALTLIPKEKIILGVPLYGYEWETITDFPRSATIPASALTDSNRRAEQFLEGCATCSAQTDNIAREQYVIYKDKETGTFHQMFFPNEQSMAAKVNFAKSMNLGGIGLWALGFEGNTILDPLKSYK